MNRHVTLIGHVHPHCIYYNSSKLNDHYQWKMQFVDCERCVYLGLGKFSCSFTNPQVSIHLMEKQQKTALFH